jgi:voltage-gated sodium channel
MQKIFDFNKKIAESNWFSTFIISVIVLAGIIVGIQTYGERVAHIAHILDAMDLIILLIFTVEVVIKMLAEGKKPWNYFKDSWNVFDFTIVAVAYLAFIVPTVDASFVAVLRLARILRVFKLVNAVPKLQLLVGALLKSIPSMGYVGILLGLLFYIYAAMGVFIFGENDPVHFGNLQHSMLSLFRIVTLEDWTDIMYINMYGCDHSIWGYGAAEGCTNPQPHGALSAFFFVSFVLIGTMIILNLFIGVIMNSMDEARAEAELANDLRRRGGKDIPVSEEIKMLSDKIDDLKDELNKLYNKSKHEEEKILKLKEFEKN